MSSPTVRTLEILREDGWIADIVERFVSAGERSHRKDAFGFGDILAADPVHPKILLVQACATASLANRIDKIARQTYQFENARRWFNAGGLIWVIGWKKYAKPIDRKYWRPTIRVLDMEMLQEIRDRKGPADA